MSEVRSPTVRRRELGALLRKLRTEKGLTVEQAADRLLFSMSKLSRMETGHGVATPRDIRDLCDLYGVTDEAERDRMMQLAAEGKQQAWWQSYDLGYATYVGPGSGGGTLSAPSSHRWCTDSCKQRTTRAPATRAPCPGSAPIRSSCRSRRSSPGSASSRGKTRRRFDVVLDEAALHRVIGRRQVMAAQLAKILDMAALPHVTVQVLPYEVGAHPAMESNFNILRAARSDSRCGVRRGADRVHVP